MLESELAELIEEAVLNTLRTPGVIDWETYQTPGEGASFGIVTPEGTQFHVIVEMVCDAS